MFTITVQQSEKANSKCEIYKFSLEQLSEAVGMLEEGPKNGTGFIRGRLTKPERKDENLEYSKLLIIDADGGLDGKPTPEAHVCHEALKSLGYNHVIYSTHSHSASFHKYRAVIELSEEIQHHELIPNMTRLVQELFAHGCQLKYVTEMKVWSQIWFLPRRDNPSDGLFIHLSHFTGECFETIHCEPSDVVESEESESSSDEKFSSHQTLDDLFNNIYEGVEVHTSMRNISYQLAKDGVAKPIIISTLRNTLRTSKIAGTERGIQRDTDIERLVEGGIARANKESADEADFVIRSDTFESSYYAPPMPPGMMGRFVQQTIDSMPNSEAEFAFPMVLGALSGICGAHFNVYSDQYSGLNMNMAVVASTGHGKSQIGKFYKELFAGGLNGKIVNLSGTAGAISFLGSSSYTAPKSLHDELCLGRSRVSCMPEAGIMLGAKSGNVDELTAYIMENYVNSAHNNFSVTKSYSSSDNNLKMLRAPAHSLVMESTEDELRRSLTDMNAISSGFIPRTTMFKLGAPGKKNRNRNKSGDWKYDDDIISKISRLIGAASASQVEADFKFVKISLTDEQYEKYCDYIDEYKRTDDKSPIDIAMCSRMAHKMIKFAGLCYCFNTWNGGDDVELDDASWEWAQRMCQWELDNIGFNLSYMSVDNEYDIPMQLVTEKLISSLEHKSTTPRQRMAKVVSINTLYDRLYVSSGGGKGKIARFASERKMPAEQYIDMLLKMMERLQKVKLHDNHKLFRKGVRCIQILEGINNVL
jgi:hypothetical protein